MDAKLVKTSTPGIYKRGSRYVVIWRHRGKQHKSFHRTLAEAREAQGERRRAEGRAPASRLMFGEYAAAWLDSYAGRTGAGIGEGTRGDYRRSIEAHAIPFFDGNRLAEIEPPDVRRFVGHLEGRGVAAGTVVKDLAPLRALFATAVEDGTLRANPTAGVRVNRRRAEADEEVEAKAMTRAELASVLAAVPEHRRLFFVLLAHTGLRVSEAIGLDWDDLQLGASPVLHVRRQHYRGTTRRLKTRSGRRDLPLSTGLARALWAARPANGEGPMFPSGEGTRLWERNVRRVLDSAGDQAGVPGVSFHTFRHTCASMLFEAGKNIRQVADWLGHSDPSFTLRTYVHLMDGGLGGADFLDAAVNLIPDEEVVGNKWATQGPETASNAPALSTAETAV